MFVKTTKESRQFFLDVRQKMLSHQILQPLEAMIADILTHHPEYDELLGDAKKAFSDEYIANNFDVNPFLHLGLHVALQEQLDANRPTGISSVYQHLKIKVALDDHNLRHLMMQCLAQSLQNAQASNSLPDESEYLRCLRQL